MFCCDDIELAIATFNYGANKPVSNGCEARFYSLDGKIGFKLYNSEWQRDNNHDKMRLANDFDEYLCAKVGPKFNCTDKYGDIHYGFLVEQLDITLMDYAANKFGPNCSGRATWKKYDNSADSFVESICDTLQDAANSAGLDFADNHAGNIATNLDDNGEPIQWLIIDIGDNEQSDYDSDSYSDST
jgi:hypothetical protein